MGVFGWFLEVFFVTGQEVMSLNCWEGQLSIDTRIKLSNSKDKDSEAGDQFIKTNWGLFKNRLDNSVINDLDHLEEKARRKTSRILGSHQDI